MGGPAAQEVITQIVDLNSIPSLLLNYTEICSFNKTRIIRWNLRHVSGTMWEPTYQQYNDRWVFNCGFYIPNLMNLVIGLWKVIKILDQTWLLSGFLVNVNITEKVGVTSVKYTIVIIATTLLRKYSLNKNNLDRSWPRKIPPMNH